MPDPLKLIAESVLAQQQIRRENAARVRKGLPPLTPDEEHRIISRLSPESLASKKKAVLIYMPEDYERMILSLSPLESIAKEDMLKRLHQATWVYFAIEPTENKQKLGQQIQGIQPDPREYVIWRRIIDEGYEPVIADINFDPFYYRVSSYTPVSECEQQWLDAMTKKAQYHIAQGFTPTLKPF